MDSVSGLILGGLSVWRITHLLQAEQGPWDIVSRFRMFMGKSFVGRAVDCFYCLSLWVALPFALTLAADWQQRFLLWLSFSAATILLERLTNPEFAVKTPIFFQEEE